MFPSVKLPLILAAGFSAAAFPCPLCGGGTQLAGAQGVTVATRARIRPWCGCTSPG